MYIIAYRSKRRDGRRHIFGKYQDLNEAIFIAARTVAPGQHKRNVYTLHTGDWKEIGRFYLERDGKVYYKERTNE